jgi:hypothetical protein
MAMMYFLPSDEFQIRENKFIEFRRALPARRFD